METIALLIMIALPLAMIYGIIWCMAKTWLFFFPVKKTIPARKRRRYESNDPYLNSKSDDSWIFIDSIDQNRGAKSSITNDNTFDFEGDCNDCDF